MDNVNALKISDFDYDLPQELIAQTPIEPRDASRLLVVRRTSGTLEIRGRPQGSPLHSGNVGAGNAPALHFRDIGQYLRPGDLLIANQSRVIPARLLGHRAETGGAVEVLLLAERPDLGPDHWETLVRPGRRLREGTQIIFGDRVDTRRPQGPPLHLGNVGAGLAPALPRPLLRAEILQRTEAGGRIVRFWADSSEPGLAPALLIERLGRMPLPPYIHETLTDPERYQTVYARISGSAAAPTAGLHFTPQLLDHLRRQGVRIGFVTLHVGLDTFRPVECEDVSEHKMHSEEIDVDAPTAELINETQRAGGRIIAVGTTSMRVLESVAARTSTRPPPNNPTTPCPYYDGHIEPFHGHTRLFITPGYRFRLVDALITNFHLPRSTLLLLVSAFAGKQLIEKAYREAIRERYRFFSFGDAMLIL